MKKFRRARRNGLTVRSARDFVTSESFCSQEYFVYFKSQNCTIEAKDPATGGKTFQEYARKKGSGANILRPAYYSRFALSDICCWSP